MKRFKLQHGVEVRVYDTYALLNRAIKRRYGVGDGAMALCASPHDSAPTLCFYADGIDYGTVAHEAYHAAMRVVFGPTFDNRMTHGKEERVAEVLDDLMEDLSACLSTYLS